MTISVPSVNATRTIDVDFKPLSRLAVSAASTGTKADTLRDDPNACVTFSTGALKSAYCTTSIVSVWFGTVSGRVSGAYLTSLPIASQYCTPSPFSTSTCLR